MDVWRITVAVVRRWYVFLPLLALTLLAALQVGAATPTQHQVSATAILVAGDASSEEQTSAYGGRSATAEVLVVVLDAPEVREAIEAEGLVRDYEVRAEDDLSIIDFVALGDTRAEGLATVTAVVDLARQELAERQTAADIPPGDRLEMQVLQPPHVAEVVAEGKLRNMAIVGVLGAALSLLAAILFDDIVGLLKHWKRHPRRRATTGKDDVDAVPNSPDSGDEATTDPRDGSRGRTESGPDEQETASILTSAADDTPPATPVQGSRTDPVQVGNSSDGHP
ncbi:hypothetical protein O9K63_10015 [Janibacter cremeus]|uniref:hypothetical protein n=1 Tax=Janibacter cremeus TaxID=1285192 RepID=UPI0023F64E81|nr:hypothetical protein [Janibacter cremeus]WEV76930.1 hypothetical protein O9K63_10015 [Janibacter cremeus]